MPDTPSHDESHLKVLRLLESDPGLSQRDLSQALGVSLGKTNYCIRALLDKGLIKMQNFRRSEEHTSELQSLMRLSYAVFCLKKKTQHQFCCPPANHISSH